ncbi:hypothetical protein [Moorena producens]|uniref:hypothetical protein n=1 Tax=Moorena producens TaxID=1155739 RepID=UPI0010552966|nr:hypothetical protein [Moorena producens]NEP69323.1 hypothetical protein [Moorena sp. SIO3A5]
MFAQRGHRPSKNPRPSRAGSVNQGYSHLVQIASNHHPAESRMCSVDPLLASRLFPHVYSYTFSYQQALDKDGLIGRAMSVSYIPREGLAHQKLISDLQELYNSWCDHKGLVYLTYRTKVYLAQPEC